MINNYFVAPIGGMLKLSSNKIEKGILFASHAAYDVYDLKEDGAEKWVKALIITLSLISKNHFSSALNVLKSQKDLYYATKFIGSAKDIIEARSLTANDDNEIRIKRVTTRLLDIGNFLDTAQFLKKNEIFKMQWTSYLANKIGSSHLSTFGIILIKFPY